MSFRTACTYLIATLCAASLGAQQFSLTGLHLESAGHFEPDANYPTIMTAGSISGRFVPVDFLRFKAGASFLTLDTATFVHPSSEKNVPGVLTFDGASVTSPNLLSSGVNISVFSGTFEDPASDTLLRELLKVEIAEPEFLDMPAGRAFASDTWINGVGLAATGTPGNGNAIAGLYAYWNTLKGNDSLSTCDLRLGIAGDLLRANAFAGFSSRFAATDNYFRGGFSSILVSQSGGEIYAEAGVRKTKAGASELSRSLYFLFEPRLVGENADVAFTFFSVPLRTDASGTASGSALTGTSLTSTTEGSENTYLGSNILVGFGNLKKSRIRGGFSVLGCIDPLQPKSVSPVSFSVSPFCSVMIDDFRLNMTVVINPLLLDNPAEMGEIQISLKAVL
jgi:hypothetical protein